MSKMNPEVKSKWIAELLSGQYEQGREALSEMNWITDTQCFCCLGVLTDVYAKEKHISWQDGSNLRGTDDEGEINELLHPDVAEWAGISTRTEADGTQGLLADMNDGGATFPTIAAYIEENL